MSYANPCLPTTLNSYLYQEYADDDNLQAFVASYNEITQQYVNTFNGLNLPIYTQPIISGALLDWVGQGIYGYMRPTLPSVSHVAIGPLNTYGPNEIFVETTHNVSGITQASPAVITTSASHGLASGNEVSISGVGGMVGANGTWFVTVISPTTFSIPYNSSSAPAYTSGGVVTQLPHGGLPLNTEITIPGVSAATSDDVYKRLLTWHFYKGDGKVFSINWLKKRITRFMIGVNGTAPIIDQTYNIGVTFSGSTINITLPAYPLASTFVSAVGGGVVELPFQFSYSFTVSGNPVSYT